jgi:hypothetical protein
MGNIMAINFHSDNIKAIGENFARLREPSAGLAERVSAEVAQYSQTLNAALANLSTAKPTVAQTAAGEATYTSATITGASKSIASLFAVAMPDRGHSRG